MILVGHQPEYIPWIGFFSKIASADCYMIVDHVQFNKKYFQNRVRIRDSNGWSWLTVPVFTKDKFFQRINEVEINRTILWQKKHWKTISLSYRKSRFFKEHSEFFFDIYQKPWEKLVDLNVVIIKYLVKAFNIKIKILKSSDFPEIKGEKTDLIIDMCRAVKADTYISGAFGRDYLDERKVKDSSINLLYQKFTHPVYKQVFAPFIPNISAIDVLFNYGSNAKDIITESSTFHHA